MIKKRLDNPWGLVVVFSAFMIQVIGFGISTSFGVYVVELLKHFDTSVAVISLIGSVNIGVYQAAGPLASLLMRKMSHRKVSLLGALLSTIGMISIPFSPNAAFLLVFYGIITGLGFCLTTIPSHVLSGLYYNEHRSLATGTVFAGSSLGGIIFPSFLQFLIDEYGWRGSLLILAGVNLHGLVFASLLRAAPIQTAMNNTERTVNISPEEGMDAEVQEGDRGETPNESSLMMANENQSADVNPNTTSFLQIWRNIPFVIYFVNNFLWNMGIAIIFILGPEYFTHLGFSPSKAALLVSFYNIGGFIGCILGAGIGNIRTVNRLYLFITVNIIFGLLCLFLPFSFVHTMSGLTVVNIFIGLFFGLILGLLVVVATDLVGSSSLGDALGFIMLANGVGSMIGPPAGGWLQELTGSAESYMFFASALNIFSALVMFAIPIAKKCQEEHSDA